MKDTLKVGNKLCLPPVVAVKARKLCFDLLQIRREDIDRRDLWVTAFSVLSQLNKLVVTLTTKEICKHSQNISP